MRPAEDVIAVAMAVIEAELDRLLEAAENGDWSGRDALYGDDPTTTDKPE